MSNDKIMSHFREYRVCQGIHISLTTSHFESVEDSTTYQRAKLGDDLAILDKIAAQNLCAPTSSSHFLYQSRNVIRKEIFQSTFCIKLIVNTIWWQFSSANI